MTVVHSAALVRMRYPSGTERRREVSIHAIFRSPGNYSVSVRASKVRCLVSLAFTDSATIPNIHQCHSAYLASQMCKKPLRWDTILSPFLQVLCRSLVYNVCIPVYQVKMVELELVNPRSVVVGHLDYRGQHVTIHVKLKCLTPALSVKYTPQFARRYTRGSFR